MKRRSMLQVLFGAVGLLPLASSWSPSWPVTPTEQQRQATGLAAVRMAVIDVTGYADRDLEVAWHADQFTVTLTNSRMNQASPRKREMELQR